MLLPDNRRMIQTCVQEESNLQRIAQDSLVSLQGNRTGEQPVPCHANRYNKRIVPSR